MRLFNDMAAFSVAAFIILGADTASAWTGSAQFFGAAINAGTDPNQTFHTGGDVPFATYFNMMQEDASMGWDQLQPNPQTFSGGTLGGATSDYNYAKVHSFPYRWPQALYRDPSQGPGMPAWVSNLSNSDALNAWKNLLAGVAAAMPNMDFVTVYNEPIHTSPPSNLMVALGGQGSSGWDWLIKAFQIIRSYFPNASLGVNEWGAELTGSWVHSPYVSLLRTLKNAGVLQWYGLENYWGPNFPDNPLSTNAATLAAGLNDYESQVPGIPIYCTEFTPSTSDDAAQLSCTQTLLPVYMNDPRVFGISIWNPDYVGPWFTSNGLRPAFQWMVSNVPLPLPKLAPKSPQKLRIIPNKLL